MLTVIAATVAQSLLMAAPCPPRPLSTHCSIHSTARTQAPRALGATDRPLRSYSSPTGSTAPPRCPCSAPSSAPGDDAGTDQHTSLSVHILRVADTPRTAGASPLDNRDLPRGPVPELRPRGLDAENETATRRAISRGTREALFKAYPERRYDALDALAAEYRSPRARTPSGHWKLTFFYNAFETMFSGRPFYREPDRSSFAGAIESWAKEKNSSPTSGIVYATLLMHEAVAAARPDALKDGGGPHSDIYKARVAKALAFLEANKARLSVDPHWYAVKLSVLRLAEPTLADVLEVVQEAGRRWPDYFPTYFSALDIALELSETPEKDIPAIIESLAGMGGVREGNGLYARLHWSLMNQIGIAALAIADWPRMVRGMDDVATRFPDRWNIEHFAMFACAMNDAATTRSYLARISGAPNMSIWTTPERLAYCSNLTPPVETKP